MPSTQLAEPCLVLDAVRLTATGRQKVQKKVVTRELMKAIYNKDWKTAEDLVYVYIDAMKLSTLTYLAHNDIKYITSSALSDLKGDAPPDGWLAGHTEAWISKHTAKLKLLVQQAFSVGCTVDQIKSGWAGPQQWLHTVLGACLAWVDSALAMQEIKVHMKLAFDSAVRAKAHPKGNGRGKGEAQSQKS
jgi:hypothetical protein